MKTIGYVSTSNPFTDRKGWSGSIYKTREAIEQAGYEVVWVRIKLPLLFEKALRIILKVRYGFTDHHPLMFRLMAKYTDWSAAQECDILFFIGNAQIMKYAPINKKYIYFTDACLSQMVDYYYHNLRPSHIKLGNREEKWAINNAQINIRTSDWAKKCAIDYYKDNPNKNYVIEFGPNIDKNDIKPNIPYDGKILNILFSGVNWERKGGDIAVEAVKFLNDNGITSILHICGIKNLPKKYDGLPYINNIGFLNKNNPTEYNKYINIIRNCNILLLPTIAECAGIVFPECSAFGLPIFTHDTGGIGNYVINGINGYRLPLGSTGQDFGKKIQEIIIADQLDKLRAGCFELYEDKLNWEKWSLRFKTILEGAHNMRKHPILTSMTVRE